MSLLSAKFTTQLLSVINTDEPFTACPAIKVFRCELTRIRLAGQFLKVSTLNII